MENTELELTELQKAQKRLYTALKSQPNLDPLQAGIGGYLNSGLLSARLDALTDVLLHVPNATEADLELAFTKACHTKAQQIEDATRRIQPAKVVPKLHLAN